MTEFANPLRSTGKPCYIFFERYLGDQSPQRFEITDKASEVSLFSLWSGVDILFDNFLRSECDRIQYHRWTVLLDRRPLSQVLLECFEEPLPDAALTYVPKHLNLNSRNNLTPDELNQALKVLGNLGHLISDISKSGTFEKLKLISDPSVAGRPVCELATAFRRAFHDNTPLLDTEYQDHLLVPRFFNVYLRENYFFKRSKSQEEIVQHERDDLSNRFQHVLKLLLESVCQAVESESYQSKILHSLLKAKNIADLPGMQNFLELIPNFLAFKSSIVEQTEALLFDSVPRALDVDCSPPKIKIARFPGGYQLLPSDNFFFTDKNIKTSTSDSVRFPKLAQQPGSDSMSLVGLLRDISIFQSDGSRVYRGDLATEQISSIQGPFYVLSFQDAYTMVPLQAILELAVDDQYSTPAQPSRLASDYVKAKAIGKIQHGEYLANPIELPEIY